MKNICTIIAIILIQFVWAQDTNPEKKEMEISFNNLEVPNTPAFILLDEAPTSIQRPNSTRAFALDLIQDVTEDGDHPLLRWMGGYFANRSCPHHESIARIYPAATITPSAPEHPVSRGWKPFTLHDEPYTNNYFGPDNNQPAPNVTILATSMLPPQDPKKEAVAWCVDRKEGGRGFGIVMPHFYKNWKQDDLRKFILNAIIWTAKREVPEQGVETSLEDLKQFDPAAVEFVKRKK